MNRRYGNHARLTFPYATKPFIATLILLIGIVGNTGAAEIVCVQCHSGLPEKFSTPVKLWKESIHAESGIACNSCHGGDPADAVNAMSPTRGFLGAPKEIDIPAFCGRCHVGVLKDFLASAHGRALGKGGPTCVTCHGNHRVLKASLDLISEKTCSQCHSFDRAKKIHDAMAAVEARIVVTDLRINEFKKNGTDTETLEKRHFALRNSVHSLSHELDEKKLVTASSRIGSELGNIEKKLDELTTAQQKRKIAGLFSIWAILFTALLVHALRKTYD